MYQDFQPNPLDLGTRKLLAALAILGVALDLELTRRSGMLDELRIERAQAQKCGRPVNCTEFCQPPGAGHVHFSQ